LPVETFSIGFREESYDELTFARDVAESCGTRHRERVVSAQAIDLLPRIVRHAEEPTADSSMLPLYCLAEMARENVTVALSGDGADETMAGYETYQAHFFAEMYRYVPTWIRNAILTPLVEALPVSDRKASLEFKLKRFVRGAELDSRDRHCYWRMIFDEEDKKHLYAAEVREQAAMHRTFDLYREVFGQSDASHPLDRMLYVDTRFYLPNDMLVKLDRMTMAHSLEARVPFLDHTLVEFLATIPAEFKLRRLRHKKWLLKAATSRHLPNARLWRKKQGFNVPKGTWLRGEMRDFAYDHLSATRIHKMGLLDPTTVTRLLDEHERRKRDHSHQIWGLLYLALWWSEFMEHDAPSATAL
jgi:asparagine synthase (glutamine-hydrolysing)